MAETAGHREAIRRMTKQLVDAGVPRDEAERQSRAAAQRHALRNPRAAKRAEFTRSQNTPKR